MGVLFHRISVWYDFESAAGAFASTLSRCISVQYHAVGDVGPS
jgi:hypothetical protein